MIPGELLPAIEAGFVASDAVVAEAFPTGLARVLVSHCRPEPLLGALRRLDAGPQRMVAAGYINRGGTFDVEGMLFANRCSWAHIVQHVAGLLGQGLSSYLSDDVVAALAGRGDPAILYSDS